MGERSIIMSAEKARAQGYSEDQIAEAKTDNGCELGDGTTLFVWRQ